MKEAMEQVKSEMGSDAVILHTKKYKEGGILGYGSREMVEVTAAIEEQPSPPRKPSPPPAAPLPQTAPAAAQPAAPVMPASVLAQYKTNGTAAGIAKAAEGSDLVMPPIGTPDFPSFRMPETPADKKKPPRIIKAEHSKPFTTEQTLPEEEEIVEPEESEEEEYQEEKPVRKKPKKKKTHESKEESPDSGEQQKIQKLESELAQMKALLAQVMSKDQAQDVISLQEALRLQEVDEEILKDLTIRSGAGDTLAERTSPEAKATLTSYLGEVLQYSDGIRLNRHGVRIAALIGPTGVGKTTTLAKIAARFVLEQGISAALITADTYRISAVEQLKTYSDIIGLPLEIVYTPGELSKAIRKYRSKDLILIDTAGRSQHNDFQMKELEEFLSVNSRIEKHLVMSATTKQKDAEDILAKFSSCEPDRVIFTKTDETSSAGLILNLLYEKKMALSYLTNGQSVPDDILPASAEMLAELLLRDAR